MEPQHQHDPPQLLTRDEVARRLRMEVRTLRRLIEAGEFPRPIATSPGVALWTEADVEAHLYRVTHRHRFRSKRPKPPPPARKPKANPGPTPGQPPASK